MRFVIIGKKNEEAEAAKEQITRAFTEHGFVYDEGSPELVISIGGDGTLLEAFRQYDSQLDTVKFVGIHAGNLGFYTDWLLSEVDTFIETVLTTEATFESYPLLEGELLFAKKTEKFLALNEITVTDYRKTLALNVEIDGRHFETFRGTGVLVCTPSGSTGYNKALGGAIVHPSRQTFQLTEIASINNNVFRTIGSPIILGQGEDIKLVPADHETGFIFTADICSSEFSAEDALQAVHIRIAEAQIIFARYRAVDFWQRVRRSFIQ